jgi:hypothetical protein
MASLDKAVMNKQYQRVLVTTHILYCDLSVWAWSPFIFTLFSLELTRSAHCWHRYGFQPPL